MGRQVLLCDDDPLLVDLVQYRLAARGWDVVGARGGRGGGWVAACCGGTTTRSSSISSNAVSRRAAGTWWSPATAAKRWSGSRRLLRTRSCSTRGGPGRTASAGAAP